MVLLHHWEHWGNWQRRKISTIRQSVLRDQMYRLRGPSQQCIWTERISIPLVGMWKTLYLQIEKDLLWPTRCLSSATAKPATVTRDKAVGRADLTNT